MQISVQWLINLLRFSGQVSSLQDGQMLLFTGNEDGIYSGDTVYVNRIGNNPANIIDDVCVTAVWCCKWTNNV